MPNTPQPHRCFHCQKPILGTPRLWYGREAGYACYIKLEKQELADRGKKYIMDWKDYFGALLRYSILTTIFILAKHTTDKKGILHSLFSRSWVYASYSAILALMSALSKSELLPWSLVLLFLFEVIIMFFMVNYFADKVFFPPEH